MNAWIETAFVYVLKVYKSYVETCGGVEALPIEAWRLSGFDMGKENKLWGL